MSMEPLILSLSEFEHLPIFKSMKRPKFVKSLSEIDLFNFRMGLLNCAFSGREGIPTDLTDYPPEHFETSISSYVHTDDKVKGMFLVKKNDNGTLEMVLLQALGADAKLFLLAMMRNAYSNAIKNYSKDTQVIVPRASKESQALTKKLFPGK